MQKKIYYFEINNDSIDKNIESIYLLLYPKYIAHNAVFIEKNTKNDSFYLILSITAINNFINELNSLKISFTADEKTNDFINYNVKLDNKETKKIMDLYSK